MNNFDLANLAYQCKLVAKIYNNFLMKHYNSSRLAFFLWRPWSSQSLDSNNKIFMVKNYQSAEVLDKCVHKSIDNGLQHLKNGEKTETKGQR